MRYVLYENQIPGLLKNLGTIMTLTPDFFELEFDNKRFLIIHHLPEKLLQSTAKTGKFNYIVKGHLHKKRNEKRYR